MRLLYVTDRQVDDYLVGSLREARHVVELTNRPADGVEMAASGAYDGVVLDWSTLSPDCSAPAGRRPWKSYSDCIPEPPGEK